MKNIGLVNFGKEFDENIAIAVCMKYFLPQIINHIVLYRGV